MSAMRTWLDRAALGFIALGVGCGGRGSEAPGPPSAYPQRRDAAFASSPEQFRPNRTRHGGSAYLFLPGSDKRRLVHYDLVDGMTVLEGDILLGPAMLLPLRYGTPWALAANVMSAVALASRSHLWPRGDIPYVIAPNVTPDIAEAIGRSIDHVNQTELNVRPRVAETDYVVFTTDGGGCSSYVGRIGGPQAITVEACGEGSVMHEILHAAGFYHEQSRGDRDDYITIMWDEIEPDARYAFEKRDEHGQDIGAYDYGSVMQYGARAFSRTGNPTIITKVPNVPIGQREGLSAGDRAAVTFLYATAAGPIPPGPPGPLPLELPPGLPTLIPGIFEAGLPTVPTQGAGQACATGQVHDVIFQTCGSACPTGVAPFAGVCAKGGIAPPSAAASCPAGQLPDVLTAQCAPVCPSGAPSVGGLCWP